MSYEKTVITFRFIRPVAINLPSFPDQGITLGNFYPGYEFRMETRPNINKPIQVGYYNMGKEFHVTLLSEAPRDLPEYLDNTDPDVVRAYKVEQAKAATRNHDLNNIIRDRLRDYEKDGIIEIVSDSFLDSKKKKAPKPAAVPVVEDTAPADPVAQPREIKKRAPRKKKA